MHNERQMAANPQAKPKLGLWVSREAAIIHIHHRHSLVLLIPNADTHFNVPRGGVESWVDQVASI